MQTDKDKIHEAKDLIGNVLWGNTALISTPQTSYNSEFKDPHSVQNQLVQLLEDAKEATEPPETKADDLNADQEEQAKPEYHPSDDPQHPHSPEGLDEEPA